MKSKSRIVVILLLFLVSCQTQQKKEEENIVAFEIPNHLSKQKTTYFLIGDADTQNNKKLKDTELSEKGFEQAAFWGDYFSDKDLDLFYTSTETFAFQTMIPIVHPYKGQVRNIGKKLTFDQDFWSKTYGQRSIIVASDQQNTDFVNEILQHKKYKLKEVQGENYLYKVDINERRQVNDTLIKF